MKTKALVCESLTEDLSGVSVKELELPEILPQQMLIKVKAASVNFPDLLMTKGKYQHKPDLPFVLGMEGAGIVQEIGSEVSKFKVGDEITFGSWGNGAFSDYVIVPENGPQLKSKTLDFKEAASFQTAYMTAYVSLVRRGELQSGENLLVHGATGGVGMAAVQLGQKMGAKVIATGTSENKLKETLNWGASHYVLTHKEGEVSFRQEVKELTGGKGADVIYDPVGGDYTEQAYRSIAWCGRYLVVGFAAGQIPKIPLNLPLLKAGDIMGVFWGGWAGREPQESLKNFTELLAMVENGTLTPITTEVYNFENYAEAFRCLTERRARGKVILTF